MEWGFVVVLDDITGSLNKHTEVGCGGGDGEGFGVVVMGYGVLGWLGWCWGDAG